MDFRDLNKNQRIAVKHDSGPLMIIAGAGTGKTSVITNRFSFLVSNKKALPEEIIVLTFTDKASFEMISRIEKYFENEYIFDSWISTFHSFCERVLRNHGTDIGIPVNYKIINDARARVLLKQNLDELNLKYYKQLGSPNKFIDLMINHFSRCKDELISPEKYIEKIKINPEEASQRKELARAYKFYQEILIENGFLDFQDLIFYTVKLFKERPAILKKYRKQFKYIMVDEFQDTNKSQYELLKMLVNNKKNVSVCFDENQSIYGWRGASSDNVFRFKKDFAGSKKVFLNENYRSFQNIIDLSLPFSVKNKEKRIIARKKGFGEIKHLHFNSFEKEKDWVAQKTINLIDKDGINPEEIAVLTRNNGHAESIHKTFQKHNIPSIHFSSRGLYQKTIILNVTSYFNFINNCFSDIYSYRILNLPFLGIDIEDISRINNESKKTNKPIYSILKETESLNFLSVKSKNKINRIVSTIDRHISMSFEKSVSEMFYCFLNDFDYLKYLSRKGTKDDFDSINSFLDRIKKFEDQNFESNISNFLEELNLEIELGETGENNLTDENNSNKVKILTVHSAKGLEFKCVFLMNLVDKIFPSTYKKNLISVPIKKTNDIEEKANQLIEERKLFYVAITRPMEKLFITSADDYGGKQTKKKSIFLNELKIESLRLDEPLNSLKNKKKKPKTNEKKETIFFSYTQLAAYSTCPLQYFFAHILKIPTKPKPSNVFGKTMHSFMHQLLFEINKKNLNEKELHNILTESWNSDWYDSKKQEKEYFDLAKKVLKSFLKEAKKNKPEIAVIENKPALEYSFMYQINKKMKIKGKIDRIDEKKEFFEIIDYKTGVYKERLEEKDKKQLILYGTAMKEKLKNKPIKLTYLYLNEWKKHSFELNDKIELKTINEINYYIEKINLNCFDACPGWHCQWCDFSKICEFAKK